MFLSTAMSPCCIYDWNDQEKSVVQEMLKSGDFDQKTNRGFGCMFGMFCGDFLGHPMEFSDVRYGVDELKSSVKDCVHIWSKPEYNRFRLKPGQWTDDASMGLCLCDTFLVKDGEFDPLDLRLRFLNWWTMGYNNAFGWDSERKSKSSVGLGGNISESMQEFLQASTPYTKAGNRNTSGNGSIMRNAAPCLVHWNDVKKCMEVSRQQSKTTHQGDEAAECCALMSYIMVKAMNMQEEKIDVKALLDSIVDFPTEFYSMKCMVESKQEEPNESNAQLKLEDRNWNWKAKNFKYSPTRSREQPGYVGSYCMDAMAMSLHCLYTTNSFEEALLKIINMRGDADSTGSVCGQMAGAIYGVKNIPKEWIDCIQQWDNQGMIALKAQRLMKLKKT